MSYIMRLLPRGGGRLDVEADLPWPLPEQVVVADLGGSIALAVAEDTDAVDKLDDWLALNDYPAARLYRKTRQSRLPGDLPHLIRGAEYEEVCRGV